MATEEKEISAKVEVHDASTMAKLGYVIPPDTKSRSCQTSPLPSLRGLGSPSAVVLPLPVAASGAVGGYGASGGITPASVSPPSSSAPFAVAANLFSAFSTSLTSSETFPVPSRVSTPVASLQTATNVTASVLPPLSSAVTSSLPVNSSNLSVPIDQHDDSSPCFTGLPEDSVALDCAGLPLAQPEVIDSDSDTDDVTVLPSPTPDAASRVTSPDVEVVSAPPPSVTRKPKRTARMNANSRVAVGSRVGMQKIIKMRRGKLRLSVPGKCFLSLLCGSFSILLVFSFFRSLRGFRFRASFSSCEEGCANFCIVANHSPECQGCLIFLGTATHCQCYFFSQEDLC